MSTLQFLRERAGILVAVVIGLALIFFVIGDFFGSGQGQNMRAQKYYEIAHIGKHTVSYQEFQERIEQINNIYELSGTPVNTEQMSENIREQSWNQMIREHVLEPEFEAVGVSVHEDEFLDVVTGENPHPIVQNLFADPQTGVLNRTALVNFMQNMENDPAMKNYWLFFENEILKDRINTKYNTLISKGLYVPTAFAEMETERNARVVDFSYVFKRLNEVPDSAVTVRESDLNKYYQEHKDEYEVEASRDIEYVVFEVEPSETDIRETEEWILQTKEEFALAEDIRQFVNLTADTRFVNRYQTLDEIPDTLRDFVEEQNMEQVFGPWVEDETYKIARLADVTVRPDSVRARHILIQPNQTRDAIQSKELADSLLGQLRNGADFEALAVMNSDDQGSAQVGGDLGWFREGMMVEEFNEACFSGSDDRLQLVESDFGHHIIEVTDQSPGVTKYKLGIVDRSIIPSNQTYQDIYGQASQFAGTNNTYEKFNQAVEEQGYDKRIATDIQRNQKTLPGLESPRGLIRNAFEVDREKEIVLDESEQAVFDMEDIFVVAYVTGVQEEGIAPLEDVRSEVQMNVVREKKAEYLAEDLSQAMQGTDLLEDFADQTGLEIHEADNITFNTFSIPMGGMEPKVIATAVSSQEGVLTGPVKGNNGVYVLTVNRMEKNENTDTESLKKRMMANLQSRAVREAYEALKDRMEVVDMRYKFY